MRHVLVEGPTLETPQRSGVSLFSDLRSGLFGTDTVVRSTRKRATLDNEDQLRKWLLETSSQVQRRLRIYIWMENLRFFFTPFAQTSSKMSSSTRIPAFIVECCRRSSGILLVATSFLETVRVRLRLAP